VKKEDTPSGKGYWYPLNKTISSHLNPETYDWQGFCIILTAFFSYAPCPLCGQIHEVRFHAYLARLIRSNEDGENKKITIAAIFCETAKARGNQYTKRILPPFVIPECNITLANVLECIRRYPDGTFEYREVSKLLGTVSMRTIRRHLKQAQAFIEQTNLYISEFLSAIPSFGSLAEQRPGRSGYRYLGKLVDESNAAFKRIYGGGVGQVPAVVFVHAVYVAEKCRNKLKSPLNSVLEALPFFDTS